MRAFALIWVAVLLVAGCSSPSVDQSAPQFDIAKYESDLADCQGGHFVIGAAQSVGVATWASILGALHGAHAGAIAGDAPVGAAIGAGVGGLFGVVVGASEALEEQDASVSGCLRKHGYQVVSRTR